MIRKCKEIRIGERVILRQLQSYKHPECFLPRIYKTQESKTVLPSPLWYQVETSRSYYNNINTHLQPASGSAVNRANRRPVSRNDMVKSAVIRKSRAFNLVLYQS